MVPSPFETGRIHPSTNVPKNSALSEAGGISTTSGPSLVESAARAYGVTSLAVRKPT